MKLIPLAAVPAQNFNVILGGQNCQIAVYQKSDDVFIDVSVSNRPIILAALCVDRVRIIRSEHSGFIGDLAFADTQGTHDPDYNEFGGRYRLVYLEPGDV